MPTEQQIRQAICCPHGCVRKSGDCLSFLDRYVPHGSVEAVMELFEPKKRQQFEMLSAQMLAERDMEIAWLREVLEKAGEALDAMSEPLPPLGDSRRSHS